MGDINVLGKNMQLNIIRRNFIKTDDVVARLYLYTQKNRFCDSLCNKVYQATTIFTEHKEVDDIKKGLYLAIKPFSRQT